MPDASDILEDPTAELNTALALAEDGQAHDAMDCFMRLHRHKKAGGSLPAQWRGEGTAVGKMIAELAGNAYIFHINSFGSACDASETDWRELQLDAEAALRAVTGEG